MNAADRRRLTPALGVIAVLLAALLIALWAGVGSGAHWNDDASPPPLPPARAATPPPSVPPLENFADVWEHPLFSPDRKPIAAPAGSGNASSGDFELTGVIMLPGMHMALLREKSNGRTLRVREGHSANGATVVEVKPRSAVVDINGSRTELPLKVGAATSGHGPGEGAPPSSEQPMVQNQNDENATPEQQAAPQDDGTPAASTPQEQPQPQGQSQSQSGSSSQQTPAANSSQQSSQLGKDAAEAWAQALKARIQQRRNQAAQKQDAQKQNGGG